MSTMREEKTLFTNEPPDLGISMHRYLIQLLADQKGVKITYTLVTDDGEELEFSSDDYIDTRNPRARIPSRKE